MAVRGGNGRTRANVVPITDPVLERSAMFSLELRASLVSAIGATCSHSIE